MNVRTDGWLPRSVWALFALVFLMAALDALGPPLAPAAVWIGMAMHYGCVGALLLKTFDAPPPSQL